ncbi:MAG: hypothetical protein COA42_01840 [Alteromonadaceae bacterium]|nr:MAG: hypothetical protein COA42_01840 [Alteromonadaceae bacterium]
MLLDRGRGIPSTVSGIRDLISSDQSKIEIAMSQGRTSTGEVGRGRGSSDIQKPVSITDNTDHLLIMSGAGKYLFKNDKVDSTDTLPSKFGGTLLEWKLDLS